MSGSIPYHRVLCFVLTAIVAIPVLGEESAPAQPSADSVSIPDPALDRLLRQTLRHRDAATRPLTREDLADIFVLHGPGLGIERLEGLEHCVNLAELRVSENRIQDLKPLAGLTHLQSLDLSANQIQDPGPLAALIALQFLDLSQNQIGSLAALAKLERLTYLDVGANRLGCLHDIEPLVELRTLRASGNRLRTSSPLTPLRKLETVDLARNQLQDVRGFSGLKRLRWTRLEENQLTEIRELVQAAYVDAGHPEEGAPFWSLDLRGNPLGELATTMHVPMLVQAGVRLRKE